MCPLEVCLVTSKHCREHESSRFPCRSPGGLSFSPLAARGRSYRNVNVQLCYPPLYTSLVDRDRFFRGDGESDAGLAAGGRGLAEPASVPGPHRDVIHADKPACSLPDQDACERSGCVRTPDQDASTCRRRQRTPEAYDTCSHTRPHFFRLTFSFF